MIDRYRHRSPVCREFFDGTTPVRLRVAVPAPGEVREVGTVLALDAPTNRVTVALAGYDVGGPILLGVQVGRGHTCPACGARPGNLGSQLCLSVEDAYEVVTNLGVAITGAKLFERQHT